MRVLLVYPGFVGMQMNLDSFAWIAEKEVLISFKPHVVGFTSHISECYDVIKDCHDQRCLGEMGDSG